MDIFFIFIVTISLAATIYIFYYIYNQDRDVQNKILSQTQSSQFTRRHLWIYSVLGIVLCWLLSVVLIVVYLGFRSVTAIGCLLGSTAIFSMIGYYIYYFIFPSPFWGRNTLPHKKWNVTVDCRNYKEYETGHYANAIQWPIDTLAPTNLRNRLAELKQPVLVYDNTGELSKKWIDMFYNLCHELGIKGVQVVYTDAHWTQIPVKPSCSDKSTS